MTYTREQLDQLEDLKLEMIISKMIGSKSILLTCSCVESAQEVQTEAIEHNPVEYVQHLERVIHPEIKHADTWYANDVVYLLQATPRQRTIASILTLQGHGGTGE